MGYQYITGTELIKKFEEQVRRFPIALLIGEEVSNLNAGDEGFVVSTIQGKSFKARSVIIASGKSSRSLNVPGEEELIGRGVSYCATCDAPLFGGMEVAVVGGGNSALTAVRDLIQYASEIYLMYHDLVADRILVEKAEESDKVEFLPGYTVKEIKGADRVESVVIESRDEGKEKALSVGGVFIEIGLIPNSQFAEDLVELNDLREIVVDCKCKTNVPGVFAAGDVTDVPEKQIIVAAGEGAKAALSAYHFLLED